LSFALKQNENVFLDAVEEGHKRLDPSGEVSESRYLRSDILKGFTASPLFQKRRNEWLSEAGMDILKQAERILPKIHIKWSVDRREAFQQRILEPAFDLAMAIGTSTTHYSFSERMTQGLQFKNLPLKSYLGSSYTMIDIATRWNLKNKQKAGMCDDAVVAQQILFLRPGLLRDTGGKVPQRLTNDVVCVIVEQTAQQDGNTSVHQKEPEVDRTVTSGTTNPGRKKRKTFKAELLEASKKQPTALNDSPFEVRSGSEKSIAAKEEEGCPAILSDADSSSKGSLFSDPMDMDDLVEVKKELRPRSKRRTRAPGSPAL
ncbi:MAG: hypothetical protein Q9180_008671, partial [Flavoplaca navasiana]